jgi:IS30 family transposase
MSRCYQQLTLADRRRLHQFVERKVPINEMARQLGRHRSTIYREIRRNTFHDRQLPEYSGYFGTIADECKFRGNPPPDSEMMSPPVSEK